MQYKSVTFCIPKDKDNTYLLTFMDNIILRVLKLNVKVKGLDLKDWDTTNVKYEIVK